jgi:hypothetical protein
MPRFSWSDLCSREITTIDRTRAFGMGSRLFLCMIEMIVAYRVNGYVGRLHYWESQV